MGMIRKIYKLTLPAKVGLFVAACFGFNMSFISPLQAEDVEKVCAVKFEPCKIGGAKDYITKIEFQQCKLGVLMLFPWKNTPEYLRKLV